MPTTKLTQLTAERLKPPAEGNVTFWDSQLPGFGMRISARGRRTWVAMYRVKGGREVMETLGTMATIPAVAQARDLARASMVRARAGVNPVEAKRTAEAAAAIKPFLFADLVARYITEHVQRNTKPATAYETGRILRNRVMPHWGKRPACAILKVDVYTLLDEIGSKRLRKRVGSIGGPLVEANAILRCLKTLFKWAVGKDLIENDPTVGVLKPLAREIERDRVLSDDEIRTFWAASDQLGWPFGTLFKLMLLTAQREREVAGMHWSELDLEKALWTIPAERAKNGRPHDVALSPFASALITELPDLGSLVFSTTGATPVSGFSSAKKRLDQFMVAKTDGARDRAVIETWRLHDLRRTAATGMARLGIAPHVVDRVLNHSSGTIRGVARVYNRFQYVDERKSALEAWGRFVEQLVRPREQRENVVALRQPACRA
jgi:integrase